MLVLTPNGMRPIEDIVVGDLVVSWDEQLMRIINNRVIALHRNRAIQWIEISTGGKIISSTKNHRFWEPVMKQWIEAKHFSAGMKLETSDLEVLTVDSVRAIDTDEKDTFNLTVENAHTYFVDEAKILVHNDGNQVNGKIYVGIDPKGNPIYVGQTVQPLPKREGQHHAEAAANPEQFGFKADMKLVLVPGMDGLNPDQMNYHERRIYDGLKEAGFNLKNGQIPVDGSEN